MKIKILYNVDGTSNDKPNNYDEWIDALKAVLASKGVDISSIGANMIGAHMSDKPNDHKPIYIGAITHEENSMSSDKKIEVEFYANYDEVKEVG